MEIKERICHFDGDIGYYDFLMEILAIFPFFWGIDLLASPEKKMNFYPILGLLIHYWSVDAKVKKM